MPASQKKAGGGDLILLISQQAAHIPDHRPYKLNGKISLPDAVMSAFAVMHLNNIVVIRWKLLLLRLIYLT